jgi:hypothetical protein
MKNLISERKTIELDIPCSIPRLIEQLEDLKAEYDNDFDVVFDADAGHSNISYEITYKRLETDAEYLKRNKHKETARQKKIRMLKQSLIRDAKKLRELEKGG